jgi:hypothetical protein
MPLQKRKKSRKPTSTKKPKTHTPPTLLTLPAEIRNKIYSYAFASPHGLLLKWTPGVSRRNKKPILVSPNDEGERHSTNQLKYANKQLYRESAGLELQLNTIIVEDYNTECTAQHFLKFANFCTPTRLGWLTSVVLEQKRGDTNARLRVWLRHQMQTVGCGGTKTRM